jgi:cold shock CspA family protein
MAVVRRRRGTVTAFDDHKGWGTITGADGAEWFFHCTRLADGTRTIAVGTAVEFSPEPRLPGRYEASEVVVC